MTLEASALKAGSPRKLSYKYQHTNYQALDAKLTVVSCLLPTTTYQGVICTLFQKPSSDYRD
jgi:hypothetical protein